MHICTLIEQTGCICCFWSSSLRCNLSCLRLFRRIYARIMPLIHLWYSLVSYVYIVVSAYRHAVKNRDHHPTPKMPPLCAIRYNVYAHISGLLSYFTWHVYVKFNIHTRARAVNVYRWKHTNTHSNTLYRGVMKLHADAVYTVRATPK